MGREGRWSAPLARPGRRHPLPTSRGGISGPARSVRAVGRRIHRRFRSQGLDQSTALDRGGREITRRQGVIQGFEKIAAGRHLGYHLLDRAKLTDRVTGFLVLKQTGKLDPAGRMLDCAPAELIGHAQRNGGQVRGAEDTPGPQEPITVQR